MADDKIMPPEVRKRPGMTHVATCDDLKQAQELLRAILRAKYKGFQEQRQTKN